MKTKYKGSVKLSVGIRLVRKLSTPCRHLPFLDKIVCDAAGNNEQAVLPLLLNPYNMCVISKEAFENLTKRSEAVKKGILWYLGRPEIPNDRKNFSLKEGNRLFYKRFYIGYLSGSNFLPLFPNVDSILNFIDSKPK